MDQVAFSGGDSQRIVYDSSLVIQSEKFLKKHCPNYDVSKNTLFKARENPTLKEFREIRITTLGGYGCSRPYRLTVSQNNFLR